MGVLGVHRTFRDAKRLVYLWHKEFYTSTRLVLYYCIILRPIDKEATRANSFLPNIIKRNKNIFIM